MPCGSSGGIDAPKTLCDPLCIATNIELDERLLSKAMRLGGMRTKKEAVHQALVEYVQRREQLRVLDFFGKVDLDPGFDYKKQRAVQ